MIFFECWISLLVRSSKRFQFNRKINQIAYAMNQIVVLRKKQNEASSRRDIQKSELLHDYFGSKYSQNTWKDATASWYSTPTTYCVWALSARPKTNRGHSKNYRSTKAESPAISARHAEDFWCSGYWFHRWTLWMRHPSIWLPNSAAILQMIADENWCWCVAPLWHCFRRNSRCSTCPMFRYRCAATNRSNDWCYCPALSPLFPNCCIATRCVDSCPYLPVYQLCLEHSVWVSR